mmetsp:Transcript_15889/g.45679  ORF Transcript_15889/g.45679 Transcript_15889/m.45679 type:complete len:667 (-) Transcript_15889:1363-3363(-)
MSFSGYSQGLRRTLQPPPPPQLRRGGTPAAFAVFPRFVRRRRPRPRRRRGRTCTGVDRAGAGRTPPLGAHAARWNARGRHGIPLALHPLLLHRRGPLVCLRLRLRLHLCRRFFRPRPLPRRTVDVVRVHPLLVHVPAQKRREAVPIAVVPNVAPQCRRSRGGSPRPSGLTIGAPPGGGGGGVAQPPSGGRGDVARPRGLEEETVRLGGRGVEESLGEGGRRRSRRLLAVIELSPSLHLIQDQVGVDDAPDADADDATAPFRAAIASSSIRLHRRRRLRAFPRRRHCHRRSVGVGLGPARSARVRDGDDAARHQLRRPPEQFVDRPHLGAVPLPLGPRHLGRLVPIRHGPPRPVRESVPRPVGEPHLRLRDAQGGRYGRQLKRVVQRRRRSVPPCPLAVGVGTLVGREVVAFSIAVEGQGRVGDAAHPHGAGFGLDQGAHPLPPRPPPVDEGQVEGQDRRPPRRSRRLLPPAAAGFAPDRASRRLREAPQRHGNGRIPPRFGLVVTGDVRLGRARDVEGGGAIPPSVMAPFQNRPEGQPLLPRTRRRRRPFAGARAWREGAGGRASGRIETEEEVDELRGTVGVGQGVPQQRRIDGGGVVPAARAVVPAADVAPPSPASSFGSDARRGASRRSVSSDARLATLSAASDGRRSPAPFFHDAYMDSSAS